MRTVIISESADRSVATDLATQIGAIRGFETPSSIAFDQALSTVRRQAPNLVVLIISAADQDRQIECLRQLRSAGDWHLLAAGPTTNAKTILRTMQAGAEVYLDQAELTTELRSALYRIHLRQTNPDGSGRLIGVLSASGGCGASTIAINLAAAIAADRGQCHLIDLNLRKADLAPLLDLKPQYTIADLCRSGERLDASLYEKLLTHHSSGVTLLAAPNELADTADASTETLARAIEVARESFANIVVDVEDSVHDEQLAALTKASRILLVIRLDFVSIRHCRRMLSHLEKAGISRERVEIVVNQYREAEALPIPEAEQTLGTKLTHVIPYDALVIGTSCNMGIPAVLTHRDTAVVQSILELVGLDTPRPQGPGPRDRVMAWLQTRRHGLQGLWQRMTTHTDQRKTSPPGTPPSEQRKSTAPATAGKS